MNEKKVIVITGASSGFGNLTARALASAGHTVYTGMRATTGRNTPAVQALADLSAAEGLNARGIEMDAQDQASIDVAIEQVIAEQGQIDLLIHNAGHMVLGPTEAFTPKQVAAQYDVNVVSTQRANRAVLPHLRRRGTGLVLWVTSSSTIGGHPPFLGPYLAANAGMKALAETYAAELIKFGVQTSIVVPGAYTSGTNHFAQSGTPDDAERATEYDAPYGTLRNNMAQTLGDIFPEGHAADEVSDEIVRVVALPTGERPFRVTVDPSHDGSEVVSTVYDRIRHDFFHRIRIQELLTLGASIWSGPFHSHDRRIQS